MRSLETHRTASTSPTILVIGAGVAGCACAIRLRQHGVQVELAEKSPFPRDKVCGCCIGGTGLSLLAALGMDDWIAQHAVPLDRWCGSLGGCQVNIGLMSGIAVSRRTLDCELVNRAVSLGVTVHQPCTVSIDAVTDSEVAVSLQRSSVTEKRSYSAVVVAGGLNAPGLQSTLPWIESPHGPFGITLLYDHLPGVERGSIYMACDEDGYVGIVQLDDGRYDVAAALRSGAEFASGRSPLERVREMVARSALPLRTLPDPVQMMTTPPLRRRRQSGRGRLLAIGDAAGYVEPFTGEGMTWAAHAGILSADCVALAQHDLATIGDVWARRWEYSQRWNRRKCQLMTTLLRSAGARSVLGQVLSRLPILARPVVRSLARPAQVRAMRESS